MDVGTMKLLAAALALLPMIGSAIGLGMIGSGWVGAMSRNPAAGNSIFTMGIIAAGLTEAIALIAFVVSMLILFVS